jgi:hypothetical protein
MLCEGAGLNIPGAWMYRKEDGVAVAGTETGNRKCEYRVSLGAGEPEGI